MKKKGKLGWPGKKPIGLGDLFDKKNFFLARELKGKNQGI